MMINEREIISAALKAKGITWHALSKKLGRNGSYIEQYFKKGSPKTLSLESKKIIARTLDIPIETLAEDELLDVNSMTHATTPAMGFSDDAEGYTGPQSNLYDPMLKNAQLAPFQIKTSVLSAIGINPGEVRLFSLSPIAIGNVKTGDVVVCQAYDKNNLLNAKTIIRQYLAPNKLITNSMTKDLATIDMGKEDVHIKGVMMQEEENAA
jgi:lambda repressor-like predicted transcriptional regulator